jgi:hypothetical protein
MSRWLETELPVENTQLYKDRKGGRVGHTGSQQRGGRGRVCRDGQAGSGPEPVYDPVWEGGRATQ